MRLWALAPPGGCGEIVDGVATDTRRERVMKNDPPSQNNEHINVSIANL